MVGINTSLSSEVKPHAVKDVTDCEIKTDPAGEVGSLEYRLNFRNSQDRTISPWHSIPLYASKGLVNYICEIPRETRAKFEVATCEPGNPIKQDSKNGKPRNYAININWNYGMLPQTWEDPTHANEECDGYLGDNDPVDVVEIGDQTAVSGGVYTVKPIAALAMIDDGELDWKVIAISTSDPRCELVNDVEDLEVHFPGTVSAVREWFRTYKTFDGKPENKFSLGERAMNHAYTMKVISETHLFWKSMVTKSLKDSLSTKICVGDVPLFITLFESVSGETEESVISEGIETMKAVLEAVHGHEHDIERQKSFAGQKRHPSEQDLSRPTGIEAEHEVKRHEVVVFA